MLSYIHTSSRVCYHLNCKSETLYEAAERLPYEQLLSNPYVLPITDTVLWSIIYVLPWWMWSFLYIISAGTEKPVLYADNIAMVEFVEEVYSMRSELHQIKSVNSDDVNKATVVLGNEIKDQGATQGCPFYVEDNESTNPKSWSNSCQTILIRNSFNAGPLQEVACYILWYWPALCSLPWRG